jgi:ABC-type Fe3+ transport system permease subunit
MALLLSGPENAVLSTRVWLLWQGGRLTEAAAGAVILATVSIVLVVALLIVQGKSGNVGVERASAL